MLVVEQELDRVLTLLRNKIREQGFTQLEVQRALSWGRSYISQLLTKQKALRIEQVLLILEVIGVDPSDFFGPLYPAIDTPPTAARGSAPRVAGGGQDLGIATERSQSVGDLRSLVRGLVDLLVDRNIINVDDLHTAVERSGAMASGLEEVPEIDSRNQGKATPDQ